MASFSISGTPNPNSVKITTDSGAFLDSGLLAFNSPEEAQAHPLGQSLFEIEGIENALVTPAFVTVTKKTETTWEDVLPEVKVILEKHLNSAQ